MSNSKPKRRWFQFHLNTMLLLVLTAAWLMFMNVTPRNIFKEYGWPFLYSEWELQSEPQLAIADGLSCLLFLYFVFKISNRLNSPRGQSILKSAAERMRRVEAFTWIVSAFIFAGIIYMNVSNGIRAGAWIHYGWPIRAVRVYQLTRSYSWGYVSDEYAFGYLSLDLWVAAFVMLLSFIICERIAGSFRRS
jgi:hypothetical protein